MRKFIIGFFSPQIVQPLIKDDYKYCFLNHTIALVRGTDQNLSWYLLKIFSLALIQCEISLMSKQPGVLMCQI